MNARYTDPHAAQQSAFSDAYNDLPPAPVGLGAHGRSDSVGTTGTLEMAGRRPMSHSSSGYGMDPGYTQAGLGGVGSAEQRYTPVHLR